MKLYLDSAYVAKFYLNDPDAPEVRALAKRADSLHSSALCIAEVSCAFQRRLRERSLTRAEAARLRGFFLDHVTRGVWSLIPLTEEVLRGVDALLDRLPVELVVRAGDAIHLVSASQAGFSEIWSNDRRLLQAAPHAGLDARCA